MDAGLTEVLSTAAGEAGLSGHMQTQGAFVIPHTLNKLTLVATQLKGGHFELCNYQLVVYRIRAMVLLVTGLVIAL